MTSITRSAVAAIMLVGAVTSLAAAQNSRVPPAPPSSVSHPLDRLPIAARVRDDSEPDWMAPAPGALWVTTYRPGALHRIDTRTNKLAATVIVGRDPCLGLALVGRVVWVPVRLAADDSLSRGLARADAATGRLVATIARHSGSTTVAGGFGSVWVGESGVDSVARVDPGTNKVVARIKVGGAPSSSPWAVDGAPVIRIDPTTNHVTHAYVGGRGADAIRVGDGAIWVADHEHHWVWRIPVASFGGTAAGQDKTPPGH